MIGYVAPIPDPSADPARQELWEQLRAFYGGRELNYHRVVGNNFGTLQLQFDTLRHLLTPSPDLSTQERLLVGLVVSRVHRCPYMEQYLAFFLREGTQQEPGLASPVIRSLWEDYEAGMLDSRMVQVCRFATRVASNPRAVTVENIAHLKNEGIGEQTIVDIVSIVAFYQQIAIHVQALGIAPDEGMPPIAPQA